jgi:hypothetical protein
MQILILPIAIGVGRRSVELEILSCRQRRRAFTIDLLIGGSFGFFLPAHLGHFPLPDLIHSKDGSVAVITRPGR